MGATDPNTKCPDAKCFPTLKKVAQKMPNCDADGQNPRTVFEKLLKDCKVKSAASHGFLTSAGVALSTIVLTVALVYL